MTRAALSVYIYGLYLLGSIAMPLVIFPHFALGLFGLEAGDELWARFAGLLAGVIGGYNVAAVLTQNGPVLSWSVPARYVSATFMALMVVLEQAGLGLLLFAAADALSASITWLAIRADAEENASL